MEIIFLGNIYYRADSVHQIIREPFNTAVSKRWKSREKLRTENLLLLWKLTGKYFLWINIPLKFSVSIEVSEFTFAEMSPEYVSIRIYKNLRIKLTYNSVWVSPNDKWLE